MVQKLILLLKQNNIAIECKVSMSPKLSIETYTAIDDIKPDACYVVSPIENRWQIKNNVEVVNISDMVSEFKKYQ